MNNPLNITMNGKEHLHLYNRFFLLFILIRFLYDILTWIGWISFPMILPWSYIPSFYLSFFLINPDIDLLFGIDDHRSFITHSILYPLLIYRVFHPFWNMETAKILGIIIFTPVFIHLIGDFKINDMINEEKGKGSWNISWNFLSFKIKLPKRKSKVIGFNKKRMNKPWSITWVILNEGLIILYVLWLWNVF